MNILRLRGYTRQIDLTIFAFVKLYVPVYIPKCHFNKKLFLGIGYFVPCLFSEE